MHALVYLAVALGFAAPSTSRIAFNSDVSLHRPGGELQYSVSTVHPSLTCVNFQLSQDESVRFEIDADHDTVAIHGHGAVLTSEQRLYMTSFSRTRRRQAYWTGQAGDGVKDVEEEEALTRAAELMAEAPANFAFKNTVQMVKANPTCLDPGLSATATWTSGNTTFEESMLVNGTAGPNYECMGRCGKGCPNPKVPRNRWVYTQSCLNHDACSFKFHSRRGGADLHCGDEFIKAIGDYLLGSKICSQMARALAAATPSQGVPAELRYETKDNSTRTRKQGLVKGVLGELKALSRALGED